MTAGRSLPNRLAPQLPLARPPLEALIEFIDREKERFGVEPICRVLSAHDCKIAPSTYYARKTRSLSARAVQDAVWQPILLALWTVNYRVYGAHKLWKAALRDGHKIGRDHVARLMRAMQINGATRMRRVRTTIRDDSAARSPDLVKRDFTADRPNRLWLTDIERHEAFLNRAVVKGHRHRLVVASRLKLRAA